jgi:hypothetical protein
MEEEAGAHQSPALSIIQPLFFQAENVKAGSFYHISFSSCLPNGGFPVPYRSCKRPFFRLDLLSSISPPAFVLSV